MIEKRSTSEAIKPKGAVIEWFEQQIKTATIKVEAAPIGEIPGWKINPEIIFNPDKEGQPRFHKGVGRRVTLSGREVDQFGVFGIEEVVDPSDPDKAVGTVGLLVDRKTGDVLITAAAEVFQASPGEQPGEYLSLRSSVQGSYSNLKENKVPLSEYVDPSNYKILKTSNAGRIQGKIRIGFSLVEKDKIDLELTPNARWFTREQIAEGIQNGAPFNALFDAVYNLYNTSKYAQPGNFGDVYRLLTQK